LPEADGVDFFAALQICEEMGANLAVIDSREAQIELESILRHEEKYNGMENWWIGLNDIGHEGMFFWNFPSHSFPYLRYSNWAARHPTMPDVYNVYDCVYMNHHDYKWVDTDCKKDDHIAPICYMK